MPLEIIYCWQALLVVAAANGGSQLVKTIIDVWKGKAWRDARPWVGKLLLPGVAVLVGALMAAFVPARPQMIDDYVEGKHLEGLNARLIYASWGAACGAASSYLYDRVMDAIGMARRPSSGGGGSTLPPASKAAAADDPGPPASR